MALAIPQTLEMPNTRSVFKGENGKIGFSVVKVLVERFLESFTFATKLTHAQVEMFTVDTLEKFKYESLQDIILFFKMARSGEFGSAKKGIDSNLVFGEWFPTYLEKKATIREEQYQKTKHEQNSENLSIEEVRNAYDKAKNTDAKFRQRVMEYVDRITKDFDRQMLEDLIVDWNNDDERKPYLDILKRKRLTII